AASLKLVEVKILSILKANGGMQINAIADELSVTGPWITGIVNSMESKGYVNKIRNKNDRRRMIVTMTQGGRKKLEQSIDIYRSAVSGLLDTLSNEDIEQFKCLLDKISRAASE
ncbi:Bacterial regulatory protein, MarR, partial [mine drainage metagenome]